MSCVLKRPGAARGRRPEQAPAERFFLAQAYTKSARFQLPEGVENCCGELKHPALFAFAAGPYHLVQPARHIARRVFKAVSPGRWLFRAKWAKYCHANRKPPRTSCGTHVAQPMSGGRHVTRYARAARRLRRV